MGGNLLSYCGINRSQCKNEIIAGVARGSGVKSPISPRREIATTDCEIEESTDIPYTICLVKRTWLPGSLNLQSNFRLVHPARPPSLIIALISASLCLNAAINCYQLMAWRPCRARSETHLRNCPDRAHWPVTKRLMEGDGLNPLSLSPAESAFPSPAKTESNHETDDATRR